MKTSTSIKTIVGFIALMTLWSLPIFAQENFVSSTLDVSRADGSRINPLTTLQFGPDGRLYVGVKDGTIKALEVERVSATNYRVTSDEDIKLLQNIPNHNDQGDPDRETSRQITGIYVTGTEENPVIYVGSSDPRYGAGDHGDVNLCTNSGVISKLTCNGNRWEKLDLVRGLPHSEENHAVNSVALDERNNRLLVAVGGMTNAGGVSQDFTFITEYALAAAIVSIDLDAVEALPTKNDDGLNPYKYDIPTLDDPTRPNNPDGSDVNDPWGGNDGLNQAKIVPGGPVQIFARGFRNAYDVLISEKGNIYTIDNGANPGWGGFPANEGVGTATNEYLSNEPGSTSPGQNGDDMVNNLDGFHHIGNIANYRLGEYYGGHPTPVRANPSGAGLYTHSGPTDAGVGVWRTSKDDPDYPLPSDWPPVPEDMAFPEEGDFQNPGVDDKSLITFTSSTNGFCEYTASNFNRSMQGDILAAGYNGNIYRIRLNEDGDQVLNSLGDSKMNQDPDFANGFGGEKPLDITAQGDEGPFPGTVWVGLFSGEIMVYEPEESGAVCTGENNPDLDEDNDGYSNADEITAGTNPCATSNRPEDFDGDLVSDVTDTDDDNDGIPDTEDYFAIDEHNGKRTNLPVMYELYNEDPGTGFFGLGFTGLMNNGQTDYLDQYDLDNLVAGGAAGAFTINNTSSGDATNSRNNQEYAFQFGVNVDQETKPFLVKVKLKGGFFNNERADGDQSQGAYIGTGDQDNYLKVALVANGGSEGIEVGYESNGVMNSTIYPISSDPENGVLVQFHINPNRGTVQPRYVIDGGNATKAGDPVQLEGELLETLQGEDALAVGVISSSRNSTPFNATWDYIEVIEDEITNTTPVIASSPNGLKVYPNPVNDVLFVDLKNNNIPEKIEIMDPTGALIKEVQASKGSTKNLQIQVNELKPGLYLVKLSFSNSDSEEVLQIVKE